jgi:23S rRNA (cytidine1920-2'-O)/16S rRNA (cytidine1409-2'-O)-methyltransferase
VKQRIDIWLVERGYLTSREQAQRLIMAGKVRFDGKRVEKASQTVDSLSEPRVEITNPDETYVSRGAHKLKKAVETFQVTLAGRTCLDAGASTGGFTDYLLQSGAELVYAIDVGYGQLAWKLRQDPRVKVFERRNIRYFEPAVLERLPSLITADLAFISLELVFPKFQELCVSGGELITLIKPQFEAGRDKVGKKGVVRDPAIHLEVLERLASNGPQSGWNLANLTFSPLLGPEGNIEYLGLWRNQPSGVSLKIAEVVDEAWEQLKGIRHEA